MTRHPMYAKRPTAYCDRCESTVYADDVHSCYDAKALRAQQERERTLTVLERAVVEAAVAWHEDRTSERELAVLAAARAVREGR